MLRSLALGYLPTAYTYKYTNNVKGTLTTPPKVL